MNCECYEQPIALWIAGDLTPVQFIEIEAHLNSCQECRRFADELRDSQKLLRAAALDEFPEAMLADLRRSVMTEVRRRESVSRFRQRWFRPLRWQYATLAILLLLSGLVGWRYFGARSDRQPQVVVNDAQGSSVQEQQVESAGKHRQHKPEGNYEVVSGRHNLSPGRRERKVVRPEVALEWPENQVAGMNTTDQSASELKAVTEAVMTESVMAAADLSKASAMGASPLTDNAALPGGLPETPLPVAHFLNQPAILPAEVTAAPPPADDNKIRLEIQTRDPNIRIIWLVSKEGRPASASE